MLSSIRNEAVEWIRKLRNEGSGWDPLIGPEANRLRPHVANQQNFPWTSAVSRIAEELADVSLAWQVGLPGRELALAAGIEHWTDPRFNAAVAGINGTRGIVLDRMLALNRDPEGPAVSPSRISTDIDAWGESRAVEFYVDFETVSNLNDDLAAIPEQNGKPMIFMIGCGHVESGEWQFTCFVANRLKTSCEADIIEQRLAHMEAVRARVGPHIERPLVPR